MSETKVKKAAPTGTKIMPPAGPGSLNPGVGKRVQRTGLQEYAGALVGNVFAYETHPNRIDQSRMSTCFMGDVVTVNAQGLVGHANRLYLPSSLEKTMRAALDLGRGQPISFAVEIWCEPDAEGRPASPLGYSYVAYDRRPVDDTNPTLALAYASGIIERPAIALAAPMPAAGTGTDEEVDPETGEVTKRAAAATVAGQRRKSAA